MDIVESVVRERLGYHRKNLELWESGYLNPSEPNPDERRAVMERLRIVIGELEAVLAGAGLTV